MCIRYMTKFSLRKHCSLVDFLGIINHSTGSPNIQEKIVFCSQDSACKHFIKYLSPLTMVYLFFQAGIMGYTLSRSLSFVI